MTNQGRSLEDDKEELLRLLLEEQKAVNASQQAATTIPAFDRNKGLPLSFGQERIWFLEQLIPDTTIFWFHAAIKLRGQLDVDALTKSVEFLVNRHEVLRCGVDTVDGEPHLKGMEKFTVPIVLDDLTSMSREQAEIAAAKISTQEAATPVELSKPPLVRFRLLRIAEDYHWLLISLHHFAADDVAQEILFRELTVCYAAFIAGETPHLPDLPVQYADFAAYQREMLKGEAERDLLDFWCKTLSGTLTPIELPTDRPRPAEQRFEGARVECLFSPEESDRLRRLSRNSGVTLYVTLLTLFKILLRKYSGQEDIIIGSPFENRAWLETEDLIGLFINPVVLRTSLSGNPSFSELQQRTKQTVLSASDHQALPFEILVQALNVERDVSRSPIFQVMFTFLNGLPTKIELGDLSVKPIPRTAFASEYDLSLYIRDGGVRDRDSSPPLEAWFEFNTALFDRETIECLAQHLRHLARVVVAEPDKAIDSYSLLTERERECVVDTWNQTNKATGETSSIHALFEAQADIYAEKIAVRCGSADIRYLDLEKRANQVAHHLRSLGVTADSCVAIVMERSVDMLVALLGVLKAGGAYVPIDPTFPKQRIDYMLEDSGAKIVLTESALLQIVHSEQRQAICLDDDWSVIERETSDRPIPSTEPGHLAYVIYTSGSTGRPKGVMVEHGNVVNFLFAMAEKPKLSQRDTLLAVTTISFDIHVLELFLPLSVGATVVIAERDDAIDGRRLIDLLTRTEATAMQATPATWHLLLEAGWKRPSRPFKVLCGGEVWPSGLAGVLLPRCSELWNMYGPTEATVWSSVKPISDPDATVTIGYPMNNTAYHVVASDLQPVPIGVPGELLIGGAGVARGYYARPELTAERFVILDLTGDRRRYYRTGDLAVRQRDGDIRLIGRMDQQVKVRGFRIELGEIDAILTEHDAVCEVVTIIREDVPSDRRIIAYLVAEGTYRPQGPHLRNYLSERLPNYMIPSRFVWLDQLPKTPNMKVDRGALPPPEIDDDRDVDGEPQTEMEKLLAGIFCDVLVIKTASCFDNFFDLGGHSLLSLKVVDRFQKATGQIMQPGELFQQTIGQIAAWHEEQMPKQKNHETPEPARGLRAKIRQFWSGSANG